MFHVKPSDDNGIDTPPDAIVDELPVLREGLRRYAQAFDYIATIAADGDSLQAALRNLARHLYEQVDALTADTLATDDYARHRDLVAMCSLNLIMKVGQDRWPQAGRSILTSLRSTREK